MFLFDFMITLSFLFFLWGWIKKVMTYLFFHYANTSFLVYHSSFLKWAGPILFLRKALKVLKCFHLMLWWDVLCIWKNLGVAQNCRSLHAGRGLMEVCSLASCSKQVHHFSAQTRLHITFFIWILEPPVIDSIVSLESLFPLKLSYWYIYFFLCPLETSPCFSV